jgi:hypothetical protein
MRDHQALSNLLELLKRSEVLRASLPSTPPNVGPLVILHHPNLRNDPRAGAAPSPEEIEQARRERRQIFHVRVERAPEGWLSVRVQKEESPHLIWSSEENAPQTLERVIRIEIDGGESETMEWVPARYGAGCRVSYPELDVEL